MATMINRKRPTDLQTGETARARLVEIESQLATLDAEHDRVSEQLGDTLAAVQLGDKTAKARAGQLSMKRSGIETDRTDLRLTRDALKATVAAWDADDQTRRRDAALADLERIAAEVVTAQDRLAEQIIAAGETGQRLNQLGREWSQARNEAARLGGDISAHPKAPAIAAGLFHSRVLEDPAREVALWRNRYIAPTPIPPRPLTARDHDRALEKQHRDQQRQEPSGVRFVLDAIHQKQGA